MAWASSAFSKPSGMRDNPELVNSDPYGDGWILKVELAGDLPADLLDEGAYKKVTEASAH